MITQIWDQLSDHHQIPINHLQTFIMILENVFTQSIDEIFKTENSYNLIFKKLEIYDKNQLKIFQTKYKSLIQNRLEYQSII